MSFRIALTIAITFFYSSAFAGALDRSGQPLNALFHKGGYAEFSFGSVDPSVSGSVVGRESGDMADDYTQVGAAYKLDLNEKWSFALIYDQPYGGNVKYPSGTTYPFTGSTAVLKSNGLTVIPRFLISDRFSVYGGIRGQTLNANIGIPAVSNYKGEARQDEGFGYVVGASIENPEIGLLVHLTYGSSIEHKHQTTETSTALGATPDSVTELETPQSVNFTFRTGVATDTLLFGGIRWVNWSDFAITPRDYKLITKKSILSYDDDVNTFSLGIGRRLNPHFAMSLSVGYEVSEGELVSNLGPTDGKTGFTLGLRYETGNMIISGGLNYTMAGDAKTNAVIGTSSFEDNDAIGVGIKLGLKF